ncbi:uncharacterized protein LOC131054548 isoform X2 [Cryptomeria japonica]|uniref:uncharacterized protein LOC131054548 isoform X2 n=1 Tax=Cryptomeria japonica TaxID=3369 RepID=UPI0027DA3BD4|nr:uncharacterized protein LOC131054548 isoform X2 [Cryptomeria japonica]
MELSGNSGSSFNQHKDASENGLLPIKNEMFSFGDGEVSSPNLKTIQFIAPSSSAGLEAPASDNCIEAQDERGNLTSPAQEIFDSSREIEETDNRILTSSLEELNTSVLVRGKQIASADYNENGACCDKDILRNDDMLSGEYGGQEFGEEEIKSEASSCNDKGFTNACESVGQDGFGSHSRMEIFDRGVGPAQEAVVEPKTASVANLDSTPTDKFSSSRLRNSTMNYVREGTKFAALLVENLLQLLSILKGWASQALVKPRVIPTLIDMDKNGADKFASGIASNIKAQHERGNIYTEDLVGAIGFHFGMSVATVLAEILASNYCLKQNFSAEEISELLGFAIKESLNKDLGSQCNHLVRDFKAAFTSTYKTITMVKQAHYEKKMTSCTSGKNTLISDGRMPGSATEGSAKNTLVEDADTLENPEGKFRENTDCKWLFKQTSGSLGSEQGNGMKGGVQQFHKLRFTKSDVQITSNDKDALPKEKYRVNCQECSCITESAKVKDQNNFTCQTNQCLGNVSPSHFGMDVVNNEIEELSQKLENLMFDSTECKDFPMGNIPSVATDSTACTGANIEKKNSDLESAINENGMPSSMSSASLNQQIVLNGQFERQPRNTTSSIVPLPEWTHSNSNVFEKSLMEQERCNKLREVEIALTLRRLRLKEEKMYVDAESNKLKRQSIAINQSKASFSESKFIDKKMNSAYVDLNRTCADHLVAGLMLMLLALAYGSWKYSHVNISQAVQESQKSSWFYNPVNSVMAHIQTLICEIIVIGRILVGLAVIALFASSLLHRTVSSSSQSMPTSIILIVLGLVCGYAGKLSVDSLGGNGFYWVVQWEVLCLLHAFSAYSPASVLRVLNGPPSTNEEVKEKLHLFPLPLRKFIFHALLFVLPVMAGLTPFASVREWKNHFSLVIYDNILVPARTVVRDSLEQFLGV